MVLTIFSFQGGIEETQESKELPVDQGEHKQGYLDIMRKVRK